MVKKKVDLTDTGFYKSSKIARNAYYGFRAGRGSGRTFEQIQREFNVFYRRETAYKVLKTLLFISAVLACINAFRCLWYSSTVNDLKRENEALKAQITLCQEQKDRLESDVRFCIEQEQGR